MLVRRLGICPMGVTGLELRVVGFENVFAKDGMSCTRLCSAACIELHGM